MNKPIEELISEKYIEERQADGVARVNRSIFTDPDLFELEMEKIWEGNWIYLAHESQIPEPNDFMTLTMGRTPIILVRDPEGNVNAFVNACGHRGTTLLREECGNKADYSCPFHGWVFDTRGDATVVFKEDVGDYPDQFDKKNYGLTKVAKVESYRGLKYSKAGRATFSRATGKFRPRTVLMAITFTPPTAITSPPPSGVASCVERRTRSKPFRLAT